MIVADNMPALRQPEGYSGYTSFEGEWHAAFCTGNKLPEVECILALLFI